RDGSESGRSVERPDGLAPYTACRPVTAWLTNEVPACRPRRGVARKRNERPAAPKLGMPAAGPGISSEQRSVVMTSVMIGIEPHKGSHTAVAINRAEVPLGRLRVRACADQARQLLAWAEGWPERTWAVEGATGLGHLLAQQLVAAGERVLDIQPKLAARVRV